ncbi:primosomal protein N' [Alteromonas sp. ASW11-130]|uniref:primosomal protein N' n=1 Tax=Alteromonas sp. ASW11-130 TaxID=3015775 RepID=UPI002242C46B|nr:primosomal protein N' [Alteromonas sp. ASW11-130]MCW8091925.1 primosomal protein N' [Alteromonas sp. ASW11-130]
MSQWFVEVAVPVPLRQTFTYLSLNKVKKGCRVTVPFGKRTLVGIVVASHSDFNGTVDKLKPLHDILDGEPVLSPILLTLCEWLTHYYHHPIGEVFHTAMPVLLRKGEMLPRDTQQYVKITQTPETLVIEQLSRAPKQLNCWRHCKDNPATLAKITKLYSASIVKALVDKQLLEVIEKPTINESWHENINITGKPIANREQAAAIAAINQQTGFSSFLLEGITGSGKTEVYLQALEKVLLAGKQVLILVPEIGLTPQTVNRFANRFGIDVAVLHSQVTNPERLLIWQRASTNKLGIVIGTRSAIFTPFSNLGMIILDEEHDDSFKQNDGLRYHARDLAVVRAQKEQIPLVLGSGSPSLETLNNALTKRYHHLQLTVRAGAAVIPTQHLLDARDQNLEYGLAPGTIAIIKSHLEANNQVLVFINRKGYAPALLCHHCGHSVECKRCEQPFTVYQSPPRLQCHRCEKTKPLPRICHACGSNELITSGTGTEQIEAGLNRLFPQYSQIRIDSDSIRGKNKLANILSKIDKQEYQLLVGTQILAKGHHFPHVTLVVVLGCDGALYSADFRAPEKLAQLVTQVAGRAGRASKPGEMWLQTHSPEHPLLQDLICNGYQAFSRFLLQERRHVGLPPYRVQCVLRAESTNAELAYDFLMQGRQLLTGGNTLQFVGPIPALVEKKQGRYRFVLIISAHKRSTLHQALRYGIPNITQLSLSAKVRWSVDVDPMDFN